MTTPEFFQTPDAGHQLLVAAGWGCVAVLTQALLANAKHLVRRGYRRNAPTRPDYHQHLHDVYQNFRGDLVNPHRPHPKNSLRAHRPVLAGDQTFSAPTPKAPDSATNPKSLPTH